MALLDLAFLVIVIAIIAKIFKKKDKAVEKPIVNNGNYEDITRIKSLEHSLTVIAKAVLNGDYNAAEVIARSCECSKCGRIDSELVAPYKLTKKEDSLSHGLVCKECRIGSRGGTISM